MITEIRDYSEWRSSLVYLSSDLLSALSGLPNGIARFCQISSS